MANDVITEEACHTQGNENKEESMQTSITEETTTDASQCSSTSPVNNQCNTNISKKALKRQKKMEKFLEMKELRKLRRKKVRKNKKEKQKALGVPKATPKVYSMAESKNKHSIVLDLSFGDLMNSKDMAKCANQVSRCYAVNRRNPNPVQLHLCCFDREMKKEISRVDGSEKWDVHYHESDYLSCFERERIVYLTSDSRNVLETLDEDKVYIIGAFVDHNVYKGITLKRATENKVATARLPLHSNIIMSSGTVLAVNHVFEILLEVANGVSWRDACMKVIPPRKIVGTKAAVPPENGEISNQVKAKENEKDESSVSIQVEIKD